MYLFGVVITKAAAWDETSSKWTITGVKVADINKIQFMDTKATNNLSVDAWTQELDKDGNPLTDTVEQLTKTTITGLAEIKNISGNFIFDKELNLNFDNIDDIKTDGIYNIGLQNITSINLGSDNEAKNELLNLTLEDILDIGKKENGEINLTILGGGTGANKDKVSFKNSSEWKSEITEEIIDSKTFKVYTSNDESVKVKVQTEIEKLI